MPEYLRAFIVILVLGSTVMWGIKKAFISASDKNEVYGFYREWLFVTSVAFLSLNYWLFCLIIFFGLYVIFFGFKRDKAVLSFIFLLSMLPMLSNEIPGFLGVRMLIELNYPRILVLGLLLPLFYFNCHKWLSQPRMPSDKWVFRYVIIVLIVGMTRTESATDYVRSIVYVFIDIVIPYVVVSRAVAARDLHLQAIKALVVSGVLVGCLGVVEFVRKWALYDSLNTALSIPVSVFSPYVMLRDGALRVHGTFDSPIVFGLFAVIALSVAFVLKDKFVNVFYYRVMLFVLLLALLVSLSRGPWVGMAVVMLFYAYLSGGFLNFLKYFLTGSIFIVLLAFLPGGEKLYYLLPLTGGEAEGNVSYRSLLITNGLQVILESPFFGSNMYLSHPLMEELRQGQGIIDIVNTYIQVALDHGVFALLFFVMMFLSVMFSLYKYALRGSRRKKRKVALLYISLIAGVMVVIGTVSSIDRVNAYVYVLLGLANAYAYSLFTSNVNDEKIISSGGGG